MKSMGLMAAVRMEKYGGPEVLAYENVPKPEPAADEVLIRVRATAVNPVDWMIREGHMKGWLDYQMPHILGCEVAGTVESTGRGVKRLKPGDAVYAYTSFAREGAYAEYAIGKESEVALKPASLDFVQAASVPVGAMTSRQALEQAGLSHGQTVLIHAASGGVGLMAVQIAKAIGARVIGTASARNAEFLRGIGVDEVIDYTTTRFEDAVKNVDVVFDLIGGETQERSFAVLKKGGFLISAVSPPSSEKAAQYGVRVAMVAAQP